MSETLERGATVTVSLEIDAKELAEHVFYNLDKYISGWIFELDYDEVPNPVIVTHLKAKDDGSEKTTVTVEDLARGYSIAIREGYRHCGEEMPSALYRWDACVSDIVLQCAIFGKTIFG